MNGALDQLHSQTEHYDALVDKYSDTDLQHLENKDGFGEKQAANTAAMFIRCVFDPATTSHGKETDHVLTTLYRNTFLNLCLRINNVCLFV